MTVEPERPKLRDGDAPGEPERPKLRDGDAWAELRRHTRARIGLGRSGTGLPTAATLDLQLAHARARDAVHTAVDFDPIATGLEPRPTITVHSAAADRAIYLQRPDLGRRLDDDSAAHLDQLAVGAATDTAVDLVVVIGDGLSAAAVQTHAVATVEAVVARLPEHWCVGPIVLARQARVALGDDIGHRLGARMVAMLIGERPGLSAADSLGIYLTAHPRPGRTDAERNCISNIHPPDGLGYADAADTLVSLLVPAHHLGLTGVRLKAATPVPDLPLSFHSPSPQQRQVP